MGGGTVLVYRCLDMAKAAQPSVVNLGPLEEEVMRTVWRHGH
jgi:hypothetical protein